MKKWFFQSVPFFLFDITFFSVHLYIIKKNCGTPTINECNEVQEKNYLWIIPIQDYIDSYMDYINTGLYQ